MKKPWDSFELSTETTVYRHPVSKQRTDKCSGEYNGVDPKPIPAGDYRIEVVMHTKWKNKVWYLLRGMPPLSIEAWISPTQ